MAGNGKQPRDDAELFASLADYPYRCTVEDGKIRALTLPGTDTELEARILNLPQMDLSTLWFTGEGALRLYLARFSNPQLEAVYLRDTDLSTSIAELLARCQRLHTIELQPEGAINSREPGASVFSGALAELRRLPKLRRLNLHRGVFEEAQLAELADLPLEYLAMSYLPLTDAALQHIGQLHQLRELWLQGTAIHGSGFRHLVGLKYLRELHLADTQLTEDPLRHLCRIESLEGLFFWDSPVDLRSQHLLPRLSKLAVLTLNNRHVTDETLGHVAQLLHLRQLTIAKSQVTDQGVRRLLALPELEELEVGDTSITNAALDHLVKLPKLARLEFGGTAIDDDGLCQLAALKTLKRLDIFESNVRGRGVLFLRKELPGVEIVHHKLPDLVRTSNYLRFNSVQFQVDFEASALTARIEADGTLFWELEVNCTDDLLPIGTQPARLTSPLMYWPRGTWQELVRKRYRQTPNDDDNAGTLYDYEHYITIRNRIHFAAREGNRFHIRWRAAVCEAGYEEMPFSSFKLDAHVALRTILVVSSEKPVEPSAARALAERWFSPQEIGDVTHSNDWMVSFGFHSHES